MIRSTIFRWIGAAAIRFAPSRRIHGIRVLFVDLDVDRSVCVARLQRAIDAMRSAGLEYDALFGRIRQIIVWPGRFHYAGDDGAIRVSSHDVFAVSDVVLASVLVHEAMHLRIAARGIRCEDANQERIERLCVAMQARFLRLTPDTGEAMAQVLEAKLAAPWWTPEKHAARMKRLYDDLHFPRWVRKLMPR